MQLYAGDHLSHRGGRRYLKRIHNYAPQLFSACWLLLRGRMLPMKKDRATFILVTRPLVVCTMPLRRREVIGLAVRVRRPGTPFTFRRNSGTQLRGQLFLFAGWNADVTDWTIEQIFGMISRKKYRRYHHENQ